MTMVSFNFYKELGRYLKIFRDRRNNIKFNELMNNRNIADLNNLCKFIGIINSKM